jgi:hypothetical protein
MKTRIFSGFALAILIMLGLAQHANAQAPCGTSGGTQSVPIQITVMSGNCIVSGGLNLTGGAGLQIVVVSGTLEIEGPITAGSVNLDSESGSAIVTGAITSSSFVQVEGTTVTTGNISTSANSYNSYIAIGSLSGAVSTGAISSAPTGTGVLYVGSGGNFTASGALTAGGTIYVNAQGSLVTGTITGGANANIDLKANQAGGNGALTIGSGGVAGITAGKGGITYVTNGTSSSAGMLTLAAGNLISVPAGSGNYIILNAQNGTLNMQSGLSTTGPSGPAGQIQLLANKVAFGNNLTLTADQTYSTSSDHGVAISAETVTYGGTTTGLQMIGDGPGGWSYLLPQGGTTITDNQNPYDLSIEVDNDNDVQAPISVQGATGAPLEMTANGIDGLVLVQGYPLSFTGGAVTLQANAASGQEVEIENPGTLTGQTGLTFGGTGAVTINANGSGGPGGYVYINVDQAVVSAPTLSISTNGPSTGSGNGGTLYFNTTKASLTGQTVSITNNGSSTGTGNAGSATQFYSSGAIQLPTQTFTMTANGASGGSGNGGPIYFGGTATTIPGSLKSTLTANAGGAGTGNGGTVTLSPTSSVTLGNNAGEFALSATGGSTGGNGGTITVQPYSGTLTVDNTATPISVAVPGTTGNGGTITLSATNLTFNGTASQLTANGGSTFGNGGTISLSAYGSSVLTIGTGSAGNVQLYAKAPGSGNGGTINITDYDGITVNSADLSVSAGPTGNGNGGTIALTGGPTNLTGSFNANGVGNGNGGSIDFNAGYFTFNGTQSFTANSLGTGKGGNVTLNSTYTGETSQLILGGNTTLQATSVSGNGGTITITAASQPILTGSGISVATGTGGNGNGGTIAITGSANTIDATAELDAEGYGSGNGGTITLTSNGTGSAGNISVQDALNVQANGTGNGGTISVISGSGSVTVGTTGFMASGSGDGNGGNVTINSATPVDLSGAFVNAPAGGGGTGAGGHFTALKSSGAGGTVTLNVNAVVQVEAGSASPVTVQDGTISLNGVSCGQWKAGTGNGNTTWPFSYWDCANSTPSSHDTLVAPAVTGLPASFKTTLGAHNVATYILTNDANYNSFFSPTTPLTTAISISDISINVAAVFETQGVDQSSYLRGNMMHELGHFLDNYNSPTASGTPAFVSAVTSARNAMTGTWPATPSPTCSQVYGTSALAVSLCNGYPTTNPWQIYLTTYIQAQSLNAESFAYAFQNCSSFPVQSTPLVAAYQSSFMMSLYTYMNGTFWPSGCPLVE